MANIDKQLQMLFSNIADPKKLVFFVGAGISTSAGFPLWDAATKSALNFAKEKGLTQRAKAYADEKFEKAQYYEVFELLQKELPEPTFYEIATKAFKGNNKATELHRLLVKIDGHGIITTNFDECLTSACVLERGAPSITNISEAMATDQFFIVKPHGSILTPRSMVLSTSDWKNSESKRDFEDLMAQTASMHQFVFLGYSMKDPDFNLIWTSILQKRIFRNPAIYCCREGSLEPAQHEEFRAQNVLVIEFADEGSFNFLPQTLKALAKNRRIVSSKEQVSKTEQTAQDLEQYVFLCMQFSPTQQGRLVLIAKAIALDTIVRSSSDVVSRKAVLDHIRTTLGEDSSTIEDAGVSALRELCETKLLTEDGDSFLLDRNIADELLKKNEDLLKAELDWTGKVVSKQAKELRLTIEELDQKRVVEIFYKVLLEAGHEIAELLLFNRIPRGEATKVDEIVDNFCNEKNLVEKKKLYEKTIKQMLFEPGEGEEDLLFKKLQSYFIASAYVLNPTSEKLLAQYARGHWVYFDSSIILPALAIGHPSNKVYKQLLQRSQSLGMHLKVIGEMANEVCANVRAATKAFAEFSKSGADLLDALEACVSLSGSGNVNVFLEGFLNQLKLDRSITPSGYMSAVLGSTQHQYTEAQIVTAISDTFSIEHDVLQNDDVNHDRLASIVSSIEHLRKQANRYKTQLLCEHEARQFYLIHLRRKQNPSLATKIWYVTTDRFVTELQRLESKKHPLPISYTPRGWFQYLDIVDFKSRGSHHFSRLQPKMRFGVISGDLGIEAIRTIIQEYQDLLRKGIVTVKKLAEAAIGKHNVQRTISESDRMAEIKKDIRKAAEGYVTIHSKEIEQLKTDKQTAEANQEKLKKKLAKEKHLVRTLRPRKTSKKKKKKHGH